MQRPACRGRLRRVAAPSGSPRSATRPCRDPPSTSAARPRCAACPVRTAASRTGSTWVACFRPCHALYIHCMYNSSVAYTQRSLIPRQPPSDPPRRTVRNGAPSNDLVLSACVESNEHLFSLVLGLYVAPGSVVADITYGRGGVLEPRPAGPLPPAGHGSRQRRGLPRPAVCRQRDRLRRVRPALHALAGRDDASRAGALREVLPEQQHGKSHGREVSRGGCGAVRGDGVRGVARAA